MVPSLLQLFIRDALDSSGMDKMLVSPDGEVTITNDGATILERMEIQNQIAKIMVQLSHSQAYDSGQVAVFLISFCTNRITKLEMAPLGSSCLQVQCLKEQRSCWTGAFTPFVWLMDLKWHAKSR